MKNSVFSSFGDMLKAYRKQKKMGQQQLAEKLGLHRNTISSWERGDRLPDSRGMVLEVAKQLGLHEQETRQLLEASLTSLSPYWSVPYQRNPFFTGRTAVLQHLHQLLHAKPEQASSCAYAISGIGGIGKTQLALEYVYQYALEYHAIFWLAAETQETLTTGFSTMAELLQLPEREASEQSTQVRAVLRWLATHKDWLLVFDNVEDIALLKTFLPPARQGAVLITTRLHTLEGVAQILELPPFTPAEGVRFLLQRARLSEAEDLTDNPVADVMETAHSLVSSMDAFPLALDQAGAYIERNKCSLGDYFQLFQHHAVHLLNERSELADHPCSVNRTFLLSFEQIIQASAPTAELLRMCAFLAPDAIPEEFFSSGAAHLGATLGPQVADPLSFNTILATALRYSMVQRQPQHKTLSLHRLVQIVLKETLSEAEQALWVERIIVILNDIFPKSVQSTWGVCERLLPHVVACLSSPSSSQENNLALADLLHKTTRYLYHRAQYREAEHFCRRALRIREQVLQPEHHDIIAARANLAVLVGIQGRYIEAETLLLQFLQLQEPILGPTHFELFNTLANLANLYKIFGRYHEAEMLCQRLFQIKAQAACPAYFKETYIFINLAEILVEVGRYKEAESHFRHALQIIEQTQGPEDAENAGPLRGLATLFRTLGEYKQSESFCLRALQICEQALEQDHPEVAYPLNELATLYTTQGRYEEAEPLYRRALTIREQSLGPEHPETADTLHSFAMHLRTQDRFEEAAHLFERALRIRTLALGAENVRTIETQTNYTFLLQGRKPDKHVVEKGNEIQ